MSSVFPQLLFHCIVPTCCILCNTRQSQALCQYCIQEIQIHQCRRCIICGTPHLRWVCKSCWVKRPFFDETICVTDPSSRLFLAIESLRNKQRISIVNGIIRAWEAISSDKCLPVDFILPVPLTKQKLHQRGFNQAGELAKQIGRIRKIPAIPNLIERLDLKAPIPQVRHLKERYIKDSLRIVPNQLEQIQRRYGGLTGKRIAVIDDFMNSGATFNAIAALLKENGVFWVSNWVILRFPKTELF